jgi:hypothetical protein
VECASAQPSDKIKYGGRSDEREHAVRRRGQLDRIDRGQPGLVAEGYAQVSDGGLQHEFPAFPSNVPPLKQSFRAQTAGVVNGQQYSQNGFDEEMYF